MGLIHIESTINALKLKYFQNKIHIKKRGVLYRILREEFLFDINGGFSEEISQLCARYQIPDINLQYVSTREITEACQMESMKRQWDVINSSRHLPTKINFKMIKTRKYFKMDSLKARAILCYKTGNLMTRSRKNFMFRERHRGTKECLFAPNCREEESIPHMKECQMYTTKWEDLGDEDESLASWIVSMNTERQARWGEEFFITSDFGESLQNDILDGVYNEVNPERITEIIFRGVNLDNKNYTKTSQKHSFKFKKIPSLKMLAFEKAIKSGGPEKMKTDIQAKFKHEILPSIKRKRDEVIMQQANIKTLQITGFTSLINKSLTNSEKAPRNTKVRQKTLKSSLSMRTKVVLPSGEGNLTLTMDSETGRTCKVEEKKTKTQEETRVETETRKGDEIITTLTETLLKTEWREKITETCRLVVRQEDGEDKEDDGSGPKSDGESDREDEERQEGANLPDQEDSDSEDINPGR